MKKYTFIGLILIFIVSCSTIKLGYNNADWILPWMVDNYFELDEKQEEFVEERIAYHLEWHRYNELQRYTNFIDEAAPKIVDGLTPDEYDWIINEIRTSYAQIIERILPDATDLLLSLSTAQINLLEEKINEKNKGRSERQQKTAEEKLEKRQKRIIEKMEDWFGVLSSDQQEKIMTMALLIPDNSVMYHEERLRRQKFFLLLLKEKPPKDEFIDRFRDYLIDYNIGRPQEYIEMSKTYWEASKQMTLKVDKILTKSQKMHAIELVREYQIDFKELASVE